MIFNHWYVVLESKELKKHKPLRIKRFSEELALWRDENGRANWIADLKSFSISSFIIPISGRTIFRTKSRHLPLLSR
jgi:hypothetical protein